MYYGAETTDLYRYGATALGVGAEHALAHLALLLDCHGLLDEGGKVLVELINHGLPWLLSLGHFVELLLDGRREGIVEHLGEVDGKEVVHNGTHIGREEACFSLIVGLSCLLVGDFVAVEFQYIDGTLLSWAVLLDNVVAVLDGTDGGCIR